MIPKFRVWDKKRSEMINLIAINFHKYIAMDDLICSCNDGPITRNFQDVVLMQSTGLHDNTKFEDLSEKEQKEWLESGKTADEWQGREIFEEDIVKYSDYEYSFTGIVKQDGVTCWWIKGIDPDDNFNFDDMIDYSEYTCDVKVIGNVHQHPELLESV